METVWRRTRGHPNLLKNGKELQLIESSCGCIESYFRNLYGSDAHIPDSIGILKYLEALNLRYNNITYFPWNQIATLKNLPKLYLSGNDKLQGHADVINKLGWLWLNLDLSFLSILLSILSIKYVTISRCPLKAASWSGVYPNLFLGFLSLIL